MHVACCHASASLPMMARSTSWNVLAKELFAGEVSCMVHCGRCKRTGAPAQTCQSAEQDAVAAEQQRQPGQQRQPPRQLRHGCLQHLQPGMRAAVSCGCSLWMQNGAHRCGVHCIAAGCHKFLNGRWRTSHLLRRF
jgi:hypothetical protein